MIKNEREYFLSGGFISLEASCKILDSLLPCEEGKYTEILEEIKGKLKPSNIKETGDVINVTYPLPKVTEKGKYVLHRLIAIRYPGSKDILINF